MSVFRCKMCGGTLEVRPGESVGTCEYCGTRQTLPRLDDDRRANLYDRASQFRRNNDFDKASALFEQILTEDGSDAEAYWSLVLCRYGVEYVEDPLTHKRLPTVNRAQYTSVLNDPDYQNALRYADAEQRSIYESEARAIDEIQKGILAISRKEKPFDVFICYKETDAAGRRTPDSVLAAELYQELTREGFKVFFSRITLEDKLGSAYEPYIFAALHSAKVMVVLGTRAEYFNAVWVKNEWSRYLALIRSGEKKTLIPAYRDMDPYDLPEEFAHLQALDMGKLGFMQDLVRGIKKITGAGTQPTSASAPVSVPVGSSAPLLKRVFLFLEDSDWKSADEYCEKVLDQDPENALAYVGKMMAEFRVNRREELSRLPDSFENDPSYRKAARFADSALAAELQGYIDAIRARKEEERLTALYAEAEKAEAAASTEKAYLTAAELYARLGDWHGAARKAEACRDKAETVRKDSIYNSALALIKKQKYEDAIAALETISGWRDAGEQIALCRKEMEAARVRAEQAKAEAERKKEQARLAAEARKQAVKKAGRVAIPVVLALIVLAAAGFLLLQRKHKVDAAMALVNAGDYEAGYAQLEELNLHKRVEQSLRERAAALLAEERYEDAYALLEQAGASDEIAKSRYDRAVKLMENGAAEDYEAAAALLEGLDYADSAAKRAELAALLEAMPTEELPAEEPAAEPAEVAAPVDEEPAAELLPPLTANVQPGDRVWFGAYEQDGDLSNGPEPIEWISLGVTNSDNPDSIVLISRYALAYEASPDIDGIARWLADTFVPAAFSQAEKKVMQESWAGTSTGISRQLARLPFYPSDSEPLRSIDPSYISAYGCSLTAAAAGEGLADPESPVRWVPWLACRQADAQSEAYSLIDAGSGELWESGKPAGIRPVIRVDMTKLPIGGKCGDELFWIFDQKSGTLTISGRGDMMDFDDPDQTPWAGYREKISSVVIEPGVTSIGDFAFSQCFKMESVTIPEGVTRIGYAAFHACQHLYNVSIPSSVTRIEDSSFQESALRSVIIPRGVARIGEYAFLQCRYLEIVVIPEGIDTIEEGVFRECEKLTSVILPEGVRAINDKAFAECTGLTEITLPESLGWIGVDAFASCRKLKTVNYQGTEEQWGKIYIALPNLVYAEIHYNTPMIGTLTWKFDAKNGRLTISGNGDMPDFDDKSSVPWAVHWNEAVSVVLEKGVTGIGDNAFTGFAGMTSITIPAGVTRVGESAFAQCGKLTAVTLPEGVVSIGDHAFKGCSALQRVTIPKSVTSISVCAFQGCRSLKSVTIQEGITNIGEGAFQGCSSLTSMTIPEGVTSIGSSAFNDCSSLTSVKIPESVTSIGSSAFNGCSSLTSVKIPEGVTDIGSWTFNGCRSLTSVTIPEGVTSIGSSAFNDCRSLTSVKIPESATSIGERAFQGCFSLTSMTIPEGVTSIGNSTFFGCSGLTSVTIPASVHTIMWSAFYGCDQLKTINFTGTEEQCEKIQIDGNEFLQSVTINFIYQ